MAENKPVTCPKCGAEANSTDVKCPNCGEALVGG
jgi:predicted RNA-binding Zn-ribbon protein involved in translation (DUF1610 family)